MTKAPTISPREGTHRLFAVYESWPPYLYAYCFSGESFLHGSHLMFSWQLSFNGWSCGCCCQKFAIAGKTIESQSRGGDMSWPMPCEVRRNRGPVINFHWRIVHSGFHNIKYYVFWTGCFCTPARNLNNPRWVITRILPQTDHGTFVMIVGVLVTWPIYTQGQLLLWSSLIITGVVPG